MFIFFKSTPINNYENISDVSIIEIKESEFSDVEIDNVPIIFDENLLESKHLPYHDKIIIHENIIIKPQETSVVQEVMNSPKKAALLEVVNGLPDEILIESGPRDINGQYKESKPSTSQYVEGIVASNLFLEYLF